MGARIVEVVDSFTIKGPITVKIDATKTIHCSHSCRVEQFFNYLLIVRSFTDTGPCSFRFEEGIEIKWEITQCQILDHAVLHLDNVNIFSTRETPKVIIYRRSRLSGSFCLTSLNLHVFDNSSVVGNQITISRCNLVMEGRCPTLKGVVFEKAVTCSFLGAAEAEFFTSDTCLTVYPTHSYDQTWYLSIKNARTGDITYQSFPVSQEILRTKLASQAKQVLQDF